MQNTELIFMFLFISYIIFHTNSYKPSFPLPCTQQTTEPKLYEAKVYINEGKILTIQ